MRKLRFLVTCAAACLGAFPASAFATITRVAGPSTVYIEGRTVVRFDAAFDTINRVYLMVWGTSGFGPANGLFLNENGLPVGTVFQISAGTVQSGWARVVYSPEQQRFLVSYIKILGSGVHQKAARFVTYPAGPAGPEMPIATYAGNAGGESGMAYSAAAQRWLVTWWNFPGGFPATYVTPIDPNGTVLPTQVITDATFDGNSDPEIACDQVRRRCLVVGSAWGASINGGRGALWARYIDDTTGAAQGALVNFQASGALEEPSLVYSPTTNTFFTAYGRSGVVVGQAVDASAGALAFGAAYTITAPSGPSDVGGPCYGRVSLAYNSATTTTLASMTPCTAFPFGQELDSRGLVIPGSSDFVPDPGPTFNDRNQYTIPVANPLSSQFLLLDDKQFLFLRMSRYTAATVASPPAITTHPALGPVRARQIVMLSAAATGSPAPSVQWQVSTNGGNSWSDISGATNANFQFMVVPSDRGKRVRAKFTNMINNAPNTQMTNPVTISVIDATSADFDGDGRADAIMWRPGSGTWYSLESSSGFSTGNARAFGSPGDKPMMGDMDGDGLADLITWQPSTGMWSWLNSSTGYAGGGSMPWGVPGDVPMLADMDADGKSDPIVWRPADGTFYWRTSSSLFSTGGIIQWGMQSLGDVPFVRDIDGDGRADLIVWRPGTGTWYWLTSTSGYDYMAAGSKQWGVQSLGDIPLLGDVDGDGKADLLVWRASTGTWYWLPSSGGYNYQFGGSKPWGRQTEGDIPLIADVDGDGKSDLVIWRPTNDTWYWLTSSSGYNYAAAGARVWGAAGDIAIVK